MISFYKENKEKYNETLQYIEENTRLKKELKKEIIKVVEKYRICMYAMEKEKIIGKIDRCLENNSVLPLKRYLHELMFGNSRDTEVCEWENEYEEEEFIY